MDREEFVESIKLIQKLAKAGKDINTLSGEVGGLYAMLLVFKVEELEKTLVDSLVKGKAGFDQLSEKQKSDIYDKVALLGCLSRFALDLETNVKLAKRLKEEYMNMPELHDR